MATLSFLFLLLSGSALLQHAQAVPFRTLKHSDGLPTPAISARAVSISSLETSLPDAIIFSSGMPTESYATASTVLLSIDSTLAASTQASSTADPASLPTTMPPAVPTAAAAAAASPTPTSSSTSQASTKTIVILSIVIPIGALLILAGLAIYLFRFRLPKHAARQATQQHSIDPWVVAQNPDPSKNTAEPIPNRTRSQRLGHKRSITHPNKALGQGTTMRERGVSRWLPLSPSATDPATDASLSQHPPLPPKPLPRIPDISFSPVFRGSIASFDFDFTDNAASAAAAPPPPPQLMTNLPLPNTVAVALGSPSAVGLGSPPAFRYPRKPLPPPPQRPAPPPRFTEQQLTAPTAERDSDAASFSSESDSPLSGILRTRSRSSPDRLVSPLEAAYTGQRPSLWSPVPGPRKNNSPPIMSPPTMSPSNMSPSTMSPQSPSASSATGIVSPMSPSSSADAIVSKPRSKPSYSIMPPILPTRTSSRQPIPHQPRSAAIAPAQLRIPRIPIRPRPQPNPEVPTGVAARDFAFAQPAPARLEAGAETPGSRVSTAQGSRAQSESSLRLSRAGLRTFFAW